jgi:hypothetical protein
METDLLRRKMIEAFKGKGIPSDEMSIANMKKILIASKLVDAKILRKAKREELKEMMEQFGLDYKLKKKRSLKPKKKGVKYNLTVAQMKEIIKEKRPDIKISNLLKPELVKIIESIDVSIPVYAEKAKRKVYKRKPVKKYYEPEIQDIINKYEDEDEEISLEIEEKPKKVKKAEDRDKLLAQVAKQLSLKRMEKEKLKKPKKVDPKIQNLLDIWEETKIQNPEEIKEPKKYQKARESLLKEVAQSLKLKQKKPKKPKKPLTAYNLLVRKVMEEKGFKKIADASAYIKSMDLYKK